MKLLSTGSGEDFILRPVLEGLISYESLLGTDLTLRDIAILNDALDVRAENERRLMDAIERQRKADEGAYG